MNATNVTRLKLASVALCLIAAWLILLPSSACAGIRFDLSLYRHPSFYSQTIFLRTNGIAPDAVTGTYLITSPQYPSNGLTRQYSFDGSTFSYVSGAGGTAADLPALMNAVTNGFWSITVTNATLTNTYQFTVVLPPLGTNLFIPVQVTSPPDGATGVTNNPTFAWMGGPTGWAGTLDVQVYDAGFSSFQSTVLPVTATNWNAPSPLLVGENTFSAQYTSNATAVVGITTPMDESSNAISGWSHTAYLRNYHSSTFSVVNPSSGSGGLFGHYTFDDSFNLEHDDSGQGHDAFSLFYVGGGGQFPQYTPAGVSGGAIEFDGFNGMRWESNMVAALSGDYSVCLWLNTTQVGGEFGDAFFADDDGEIPMALEWDQLAFTSAYSGNTLYSSSNINSGSFVHLVVTRNNATGEKKIYVDGALDNVGAGGTSGGSFASEVSLGMSPFSSLGVEGVIDDLQVYSSVLTSNQVAFLYNNPGLTAPGSAGGALGEAVDAPELVWTTGGDAEWFSQTDETDDGEDAAQSGAIGDNQSSWIETTVQGPGTLYFYWNVSSEDGFDYLELTVDGNFEDEISGDWGWDYYQLDLYDSGPHTIRWNYYKDSSASAGADAAYLDEVVYESMVEAQLQLTIERSFDGASDSWHAFPFLSWVVPSGAGIVNEVESPNGLFSGDESSSTSFGVTSLQAVIDECQAGDWTLYINRGSAAEHQYFFTVTVTDLTTNNLVRASIVSPAYGASGVSTNPAYFWTGPTNASSLFVNAFLVGGGSAGSGSLPPMATTWTNGPVLAEGTNKFSVNYTLSPFADVAFSEPEDVSFNTLSYWSASADLASRTSSQFVVSAGTPLPVTALDPHVSSGNFTFSLLSQDGFTHVIECRTNLTTAPWQVVTNFTGDGTLKVLVLPVGTAPETFYRVGTE